MEHSGETLAVPQQYSLCRENFHSLPTTANFSGIITKQENFSSKTFAVKRYKNLLDHTTSTFTIYGN